MFHTHAHPEAVRLVEQNPELQALVREINHKFGASVMSYDFDGYSRHVIANFSHLPIGDPIRLRAEWPTSIMLARPSGLPFCTVHVDRVNNKNGDSVVQYNVRSPFISKDRGRGSDRHIRSSINLKMLMKLLEKDVNALDKCQFKELIPAVLNTARGVAMETKNVRYQASVRISEEAMLEILKNRFENVSLSQKVIDEMNKTYASYKKHLENEGEVDDMIDRLFTEVYMLVQYKNCPASVATVTLKREGEGRNRINIFSVHPDVKCFSTMDQLALEYPDLAISMKMFNIKHNFESKQNKMYEISNHKFSRTDKYDPDLDFVQYYVNNHTYGGFDKVDVIMVPVTKYE